MNEKIVPLQPENNYVEKNQQATPEEILIETIANFLFVSECPTENIDEYFAKAKTLYLELRKEIGK